MLILILISAKLVTWHLLIAALWIAVAKSQMYWHRKLRKLLRW